MNFGLPNPEKLTQKLLRKRINESCVARLGFQIRASQWEAPVWASMLVEMPRVRKNLTTLLAACSLQRATGSDCSNQ